MPFLQISRFLLSSLIVPSGVLVPSFCHLLNLRFQVALLSRPLQGFNALPRPPDGPRIVEDLVYKVPSIDYTAMVSLLQAFWNIGSSSWTQDCKLKATPGPASAALQPLATGSPPSPPGDRGASPSPPPHLIGAVGRDVVSVSRGDVVMVLLDFLTVECGQEGQQETPVLVIGHSASVIALPWGRRAEEEVEPREGRKELGY